MSHVLHRYIRLVLREGQQKARKLEPNEPLSYRIHAYHTTPIDNWPNIQKRGLIPGASNPGGQDWLGDYSGRGIYYHQILPLHEIDASVDSEDIEPSTMTIEVDFNIYGGYVVPDEEFGEPSETLQVMKDKGPIVVLFPAKPQTFKTIHLADVLGAHEWAENNVKRLSVKFH